MEREAFTTVLMEGSALRKTTVLAAFILLQLSFFVSCAEHQEHTAPAVRDRDSASMMTSYGVNTLISDSGVIKYKIVTERWDVNTIKQPPRWTFEKGIFMEQFDEQFHVEGYIYADTAWYFEQQKLWKLRGRVHIRNANGLVFDSEELYWDGIHHEFYSYQFSKVVTPERTLQGTYFRSDEHMAHYEVTNSVGSFQSEDMESGQDKNAAPADTTQPAPPVRKAATRHKASRNSSFTTR